MRISASAAMLAVAGVLVGKTACRTRLPEAPVVMTDGGAVDLAAPPDLTTTVCRTHQILSLPLDEILPLQLPGTRVGTSLLVRIAFALRAGCDVVGDVSVRPMKPGSPAAPALVVITQRVWRGSNDCGATRTAWRTVSISEDDVGTATRILITDGAPGATRMLTVTIGTRAPADCMAARAEGAICEGDCQCRLGNAAMRCLRFADATLRCAEPCSEDVDCRPRGGMVSERRCDPNTRTCIACKAPDCGCASDGDCPFGQLCAAGFCLPAMPTAIGPCACDRDCSANQICDNAGSCQIPCTTIADCALPASTCDGARCR